MVALGMTGIDTPLYGELLVWDSGDGPIPERSYAAAVNTKNLNLMS